MDNFSKFDLHSTNPIEMGARTMETLKRLANEHEEFTRCITSIVSDYIKVCDDKIAEMQLYFNKNLVETIKQAIATGVLDQTILTAMSGVVTKIDNQATVLELIKTQLATITEQQQTITRALETHTTAINGLTLSIDDINSRMPYYVYNEQTEELDLKNIPTR